jgi:type I restriction enzyme S subunit
VARIEELFSRLDAGVAALRHAKAQLQRYRQSVLAAAVTGQLTQAWREKHPETEPASELLKRILKQRREQWNGKAEYKEPLSADAATLYQLPVSWRWSLIGEAFNVYVGATPSRKEPAYWGGEIPWISSGEVAFCRIRATKETITERGLANTSTTVHKPGTILVGMIGEGKTRGQTAILDINACHNQNSAAIRVSETEVLPEYVYYFLTYRYEETRKEGSGGNQPALNKSRIQAIPIPLPPLAEQHQIVAEVEARTTAIDHLEAELNRQIARSTRLRQSTLATAFSGKF